MIRYLRLWLLTLNSVVATGVWGQQKIPFSMGEANGKIATGAIQEASGLVASAENPGFLWTHNDSGDAARIFLLNDSAQLAATYYLSGIVARDWEDIGRMTRSGQHYLLIGDVGDNGSRYSSIRIHMVNEPVVPDETPFVDTIPAADIHTFILTFENGPRDAESLFYDPMDNYLYVISKRELHAGVYRTVLPEPTGVGTEADTLRLTQVGSIPETFITSADISSDGTEILVKNLLNVFYWKRKPGETVAQTLGRPATHLPYRPEPQGEAIAFSCNGEGYYTLSEAVFGLPAILYFYRRH